MLAIEFRGPSGDADMKVYAEHRLLSWMGHAGRDLPGVTVCLAPRAVDGTPRVRCRMVAQPLPWTRVAVEETDTDPYTAIDRCAEKLAQHLVAVSRAHTAARGVTRTIA